MNRFPKVVRMATTFLCKLSGALSALFIAGIFLIVVTQVLFALLSRVSGLMMERALVITVPSYAELTGLLLAAGGFLGLAYTFAHNRHIQVTLFRGFVGSRTAKWMEIATTLAALIICLFVAWHAVGLVRESMAYMDRSPGMIAMPIWIPQTSMALGFLVMSVAILDRLVTGDTGQNE